MKEFVVKTQKDFDKIKDQENLTKIRIESLPSVRILIEKVPANCFIECWDSSQPTIECGDSSQPTIVCWASSQPTIDAWQQSTLVMRGDKKKVTSHQQSLVRYIDEENNKFASVKAWLKYWELTPIDGKVTLFKAVRPDSKDFHSQTVLYTDGATVECPDWIEDFDEECGHGLHCSPHLFLTEKYAQLPHIHKAMIVDVVDICLPKGAMSMPDKVRVKKVQNIVTVDEKGVKRQFDRLKIPERLTVRKAGSNGAVQ